MEEIPLLTAEDIEVKVKQVTDRGAILLLYKTARVDMAMLDKVFGAENWQTDYKEIKDNLFCGIGVKSECGEWTWKWDCGTESREDGEGNEKKGEASDAFKRAGFKWGIGRELYTAPFIFVNAETVIGKNGKPELKDRYSKYDVNEIQHNGNTIAGVVITDRAGNVVFGRPSKKAEITASTPVTKQDKQPVPKQDTPPIPEKPLLYFCAMCNDEVKDTKTVRGETITAAETAQKTNLKYGKTLCFQCAVKANLNGGVQ